jgi:hypothetical protein
MPSSTSQHYAQGTPYRPQGFGDFAQMSAQRQTSLNYGSPVNSVNYNASPYSHAQQYYPVNPEFGGNFAQPLPVPHSYQRLNSFTHQQVAPFNHKFGAANPRQHNSYKNVFTMDTHAQPAMSDLPLKGTQQAFVDASTPMTASTSLSDSPYGSDDESLDGLDGGFDSPVNRLARKSSMVTTAS